MFRLTDVEAIESIMIRDFYSTAIVSALYWIVNDPGNDPKRQHWIDMANRIYTKAQKGYNRRDKIIKKFELDSEYFPVVIIRSLLPQLGEYLHKGDYQNAYLVSDWIRQDIAVWTPMVCSLADRVGRPVRSFSKPA